MISEGAAWTIFFLPVASFALIAFVIRPFFNRYATIAGLLSILTAAAALVLSVWALGGLAVGLGGLEALFIPDIADSLEE